MAPSKYTAATTGAEVAADLSSEISGKTILVTGVSPGSLGAKFVETLAPHNPGLIILAGRSVSKLAETADALRSTAPSVAVKTLALDLSSLAKVRKAAVEVNGWADVPVLDVLVNNAGIMAQPFKLSEDGIESQFASNHVAHFLFTNLIMGKILKSKQPRIVSVGSDGHRGSGIRWSDVNFKNGKLYNPWVAYSQSKTANLLFAVGLAHKLGSKGLVAASLHPGAIFTNLSSHMDWENEAGPSLKKFDEALGFKWGQDDYEFKFKSIEAGVSTHVYCSFSPEIKDNNGAYFNDNRVADPFKQEIFPWATGVPEAVMLWELSEKLVGQEFKY